jgi:bifunctional non-homologous end joining protein LigD
MAGPGYNGRMPGGVELSNLDKVFWPEEGLTKGDLIDYYRQVAPAILPHLRNRPLTVIRHPDGLRGGSFYQKQTPSYAPEWVRTVELPAESGRGKRKTVRYTLCNDRRTLVWLANQASIELHPWLSRTDRLERPEYLVLDLDPPDGQFAMAVRAALLVRDVLSGHGVSACAKTSGAKGVHVYVPLKRTRGYGAVARAARRVADLVAEHEPDLATTEFMKANRAGKVFLDFTRIGPGKHMAAPYSVRARPGATVSFPVSWPDLERIQPRDFTIRNAPELIAKRDPWRAVCPDPQTLPDDLTRAEDG